jgi:hypothetical protein
MPNVFQRGFEAFGKPIPLRGGVPVTRPQPHLAAPPPPPPAAPPPPQQTFVPPQQQNVPPGRIQVFKKGDPGAPPCPVCRG